MRLHLISPGNQVKSGRRHPNAALRIFPDRDFKGQFQTNRPGLACINFVPTDGEPNTVTTAGAIDIPASSAFFP